MSQEIKISTASKDKEVTSRDLTRRELYHYIFQDFFRGFFLVGCLFLDILVIAQIFRYVPHPNLVMASFKLSLGSELYYYVFIILLTLFFETIALSFEIRLFRKLWKSPRPSGSGTRPEQGH